jgi:hypothetical protein
LFLAVYIYTVALACYNKVALVATIFRLVEWCGYSLLVEKCAHYAGLVLVGATGAVVTIPTAAIILAKAAAIKAGKQSQKFYIITAAQFF